MLSRMESSLCETPPAPTAAALDSRAISHRFGLSRRRSNTFLPWLIMGCLMCGLAFSVGVHAQVVKPFPDHWGEPPALQTRDLRPLPGGYGRGSSTLARWIQEHLDQDASNDSAQGEGGAASSAQAETVSSEGDGDYVIGPEYTLDPDLTDRGNPKGRLFEFTMPLAESRYFKGDDATLEPDRKPVRKERRIFVYVPAAYRDGDKAPFLVMHDGPNRLDLVRFALDNLTLSKDAERRLPAFVAISVQNGGNDGKNSQRGLEYDTMSDRLALFIHHEVLPTVLRQPALREAYPNFALTEDPWGRGVMGCSSGGAAALTMGWFRPDLFRRLITYSGTFVDQQDDDAPEEADYPLGAWEYHSSMRLIETTEAKPLRIFTHVSEFDNRAKDPEETYHNWVMANQRTAAALKAKGYHYRYLFSRDSRHCDRRVFEHTLADTLVWMWRGYQPE